MEEGEKKTQKRGGEIVEGSKERERQLLRVEGK